MSKEHITVVVLPNGENLDVPTAFINAAELRARKAEDYRNSDTASLADYFPFGIVSHTQMIWVKALRLLNLVSTKRTPKHEGIKDTLIDLLNYSCFAIEDLNGQLERRDK
jgi:hypothetical protein